MGFAHVQGAGNQTAGGATALTVTLTNNPTTGNIVCVGISPSVTVSSLTCKDSNNNSYTMTTNSPSTLQSGAGNVWLFYLLSAPANATKTINFAWTTTATSSAWAEEFSISGGTATFDKDAKNNSNVANTAISTPSITPTGTGSLLFACTGSSAAVSAPTAGGTRGVWTGAAGGILNGDMAEYDLSASGATAVNYLQTSGTWSGMAMAFTFTASASSKLFQPSLLHGLGAGGPFFRNPLG